MKTLSAANQANIIKRIQNPVIKISLTNQLKYWSYGDFDGFDPIVTRMSSISMHIDPYGGLGSYSDFDFTIQAENSQIIQTDELDNEPVSVTVQYDAGAEIPVWSGIVDNWEYKRGELTVKCISKLVLKGTQLPIQQINSTNYSTFQIPDEQVGKWVPFTIGAPYRPAGQQASFGGDMSIFYVFNAPVSGHVAIGAGAASVPRYYAFSNSAVRWLEDTNSTGVDDNLTSGYVGAPLNQEMYVRNFMPVDAQWGGGGIDEEKAINGSTADYALLDNPAADGVTTGEFWRGTFPDLNLGSGHDASSIYFYGKVEKENGLNHGGRTLEKFQFGIEVVPGTDPDDPGQVKAFISGADTDFNNVDGPDGDTALALTILNYTDRIGNDITGNSVTFPAEKLSGLILSIECVEQDTSNSTDDSEYFRIYWAALNVLVEIKLKQYSILGGNLSGYDDDGSGTYTGSANSLIETPVDVVYFILGEIFGHTGFNTASVSTARTALGSYIIAGQIMDLTTGEDALTGILSNSRMSAFIDYADDWKFVHWDLPGSADKTFDQSNADFAEAEIDHVTLSPSEKLYNQFEILYGWNEAEQRFRKVLVLDETSGGAIGTWLSDSQSAYNITRKLVFEARWIEDDDSATSFGNYLIYRYADRKRIVRFITAFNGLEMELLDRVKLTHQVMTDTDEDGGGDHTYEIYDIETDLMNGTITFEAMQCDTSHSALTDPT